MPAKLPPQSPQFKCECCERKYHNSKLAPLPHQEGIDPSITLCAACERDLRELHRLVPFLRSLTNLHNLVAETLERKKFNANAN